MERFPFRALSRVSWRVAVEGIAAESRRREEAVECNFAVREPGNERMQAGSASLPSGKGWSLEAG